MRPIRITILIGLVMACVPLARGADQFWDTSTNSGLQQGDGPWTTSHATWAPTTAGTNLSPWTDGNNANFNSLLDGTSTVLVDGSSINANLLYVKGARHHLVVTNGGDLTVGGGLILGYGAATSTNNTLSVIGGAGVTSRASLVSGMTVGYFGSGNALVVDGVGVSDSAVVSNGTGFSQGYSVSGSMLSRVTVRRGGRLIVRGGHAYVGRNSPFHQLTVSEGGILDAGSVYIGYQGAANSNTFTITDPGTVVDTISVLSVGPARAGNKLVVANSAILTNVATFGFGDTGTQGSMLIITNGGKVFTAGDVTLGYRTSVNCTGLVSGAGSLWDLGGKKLTVGGTASNNALVIAEGGCVQNMSQFTVAISNALNLLGGSLVAGTPTLQSGSECVFGIGAATTPGAGWGLLAVTNGNLALGGTLKPALRNGFVPAASDRFVIMTNQGAGSVTGAFSNAGDGGAVVVYGEDLSTAVGQFTVRIGAKGVTLGSYGLGRNGGTVISIQ